MKFNSYIKAWNILKDNPLDTSVITVIDFVTLYLLIFIYNLFTSLLEPGLQELFADLANPAESIAVSVTYIVVLYLVIYILIYLVFSLLQPLAWQKAFSILKIKKRLFKRFFRINILFICLFALINLYSDFFNILNLILKIEVINKKFIFWSFILLLIALLYFMLISYSTDYKLRDIFTLRIIKKYSVVFLLSALTLVAINYLVMLIGYLGPVYNFIASILLFLPFLTFVRVYYLEVSK